MSRRERDRRVDVERGRGPSAIAVEVIQSTDAIDFEAWGRRLVAYAVDLHREQAASSPARHTSSPAA